MNYRHAYHAGNFADVHKHVALVAILTHLKMKSAPFAVIDTHAGGGLYELRGKEALASGEAEEGIERLSAYPADTAALASYLDVVRRFRQGRYPGSSLIAATLLRPQDRLVAVEKQTNELARLRQAVTHFANAQAVEDDGYARLPKLLPPPERRGLVLLDPPYEDREEWRRIAGAFAKAYRRFAQGTFLIWLPLKFLIGAEALAGELTTAGAARLLSLTLDVGRDATEPVGRLSASGLLAVNPPYGFEENMRAAQRELLPLLMRGPSATTRVEWLAGGP